MNWTTLLRFRKQVEDLAREEVVLVEWEKSQEVTKRQEVRKEIAAVVSELERRIQEGVARRFADQRYLWLEQLTTVLESHTAKIQALDESLRSLREKLKKAYHARRVVELVIAKKEEEVLQKLTAQEQRIQEDITAHAYAGKNLEEIS